jgi:hypothetical protein
MRAILIALGLGLSLLPSTGSAQPPPSGLKPDALPTVFVRDDGGP